MVTMMPFGAERIGVPRTLAVEFPFGNTLGQTQDTAQQARVIRQALSTLEMASKPGEIVHSSEAWPVPTRQARKAWQPEEPSPIIQMLAPRIREMLRQRRLTRT